MKGNTERFDGRAEKYVQFRPSYPSESIDTIVASCGLEPGSRVADIGSGTGIFSQLLVSRGLEVSGVEPNAQMRTAAEQSFEDEKRFHSVNGTAETTTLEDSSVHAVTAAQAFHWFDPEPTKTEMRRILQPGGKIALVWNQRDTRTVFQHEYANLLRKYVENYDALVHTRVDDKVLVAFFDGSAPEQFSFTNGQLLDYEGLLGRMQSSSYAPQPGQPAYSQITGDLMSLFEEHQQDGKISFDYETQLYIGSFAAR